MVKGLLPLDLPGKQFRPLLIPDEQQILETLTEEEPHRSSFLFQKSIRPLRRPKAKGKGFSLPSGLRYQHLHGQNRRFQATVNLQNLACLYA